MKFHKLKKYIVLVFLLCMYVFICCYSYANTVISDLSDNIFRLHIIANSDSEEDQNLKYLVRDNIIEYMNDICQDIYSKEEVINMVNENISNFENIAKKTVEDNGFSYDVKVEIGEFYFPTKTYKDISIPAGIYDALEIKIGESTGKNWWCVLYPSLCFLEETTGELTTEAKQELQEELTEEEYEIISDNDSLVFNFKFKIIELFTTNNIITSKKE